MKRSVITIPISDDRTRIRVRLETNDCESGTPESEYYRRHLLSQIADQPMLLDCGLNGFDTLKIYHNGYCWVADAEALT